MTNVIDDQEEVHGIRNRVMGSSVFGPPQQIIRISNQSGVTMQVHSAPPHHEVPDPEPEPMREIDPTNLRPTEYPTINFQETRLKPPPPKTYTKVVKGSNLLLDQISKVKPIKLEETPDLGSVQPIPEFRVNLVNNRTDVRLDLGIKARQRETRRPELAKVLIASEFQQMRDKMTVSATSFRQQMDGIKL